MPFSPIKTDSSSVDRNLAVLAQVIADLERKLAGAFAVRINTVSQDADILADWTTVRYVGKGGHTLRLPSSKAQGTGMGQLVNVQNAGAAAVTVAPGGQDVLNGSAAGMSVAPNSNLALVSDSNGRWAAAAALPPLAPVSAEYLVGALDATLTAERLVTDTASVTWDLATPGQAKAKRAALTGDVTAADDGNATTIANDAVTYAKLQNVSATDRLLGRDTAGAGDAEEIAVGGGIEFTGAPGIQRSALAGGDVTAPAGSAVATIANDAVTYAKMQNVSAASRLIGRGSAAGAGDPQELTVGGNLTLAGTVLDGIAAPAANIQFFDGAGGTWTKPAGAIAVAAFLVGTGGAGGGGRRGAAGTNKISGGGGGSAGVSFSWWPASVLGATETVTVGAAPAGGASAGADNTDGGTGTAGTTTTFGIWLQATRGAAGAGGGNGLGGAGGAGGTGNLGVGATGAAGGVGVGTAGTAGTNLAGGSGAAGGGINGGAGDTTAAGGVGGTGAPNRATTPAGGTAGTGASNGGAGGNVSTNEAAGGGGGGGGASNGTGRTGGAGGTYGAGGGGGGASLNGTASGAGGAGGKGLCIVVTIL